LKLFLLTDVIYLISFGNDSRAWAAARYGALRDNFDGEVEVREGINEA